MSTRANIIITTGSRKVYLYHHHDGYPEGLGSILKEYVKLLNERTTHVECEDIANSLIKYGLKLYNNEGKEECHDNEYELTTTLHGDIEYLYTIFAEPYKDWEEHYKVFGYSVDVRYNEEEERNEIKRKELVELPLSDDDPLHVKL